MEPSRRIGDLIPSTSTSSIVLGVVRTKNAQNYTNHLFTCHSNWPERANRDTWRVTLTRHYAAPNGWNRAAKVHAAVFWSSRTKRPRRTNIIQLSAVAINPAVTRSCFLTTALILFCCLATPSKFWRLCRSPRTPPGISSEHNIRSPTRMIAHKETHASCMRLSNFN